MSGAPTGFNAPKTTWLTSDPIHNTDLARIEGNSRATEEGTRTLDQALASPANTGTLRQILSWLAGRIRAITGATNWWDAPATTLATAHTHHGRADNPHAVTAAQVGAAPLASPAITGTPTAPTAPVDTNTTQIATTAFLINQASTVAPADNGTAAVGTSLRFARGDHVHNTDATRAPLAHTHVSTAIGRAGISFFSSPGLSTVIPHGLGAVPAAVMITPMQEVTGAYWVTSSSMDIVVRHASGGGIQFSWMAFR